MRCKIGVSLLGVVFLASCSSPERDLRGALARGTGIVRLPPGILELDAPLIVPDGSTNLEITGSENSVLRISAKFSGRALLMIHRAANVRMHHFAIDGNRDAHPSPIDIPASGVAFVNHFHDNAILVENSSAISVSDLEFRHVAGFALLASNSKEIKVARIRVRESGSRNGKGRNNTSGGVLFEEGVDGFEVRDSTFDRVLGNGVWTHSNGGSPRNSNGIIAGNAFEWIARDAIQIGHATRIRVENNKGSRIGYPEQAIDVENLGTPVAIDTAGNVDESVYSNNSFEEINGKCIDLDGFHDGEVAGNVCINRGEPGDYPHGHFALVMNNSNPDMQSQNIVIRDNVFDGTKFGGIFVIGTGHKVFGNRLTRINLAQCNDSGAKYGCDYFKDQPDLLRTGIYLGMRAERSAPAKGNIVEKNSISGYGMDKRCTGSAPGIGTSINIVRNNICAGAVK